MKLDPQQKVILVLSALLFLAFTGSMVFIQDEPVNVTGMPVFTTSTPTRDVSTGGWWESIPTDPSLPTMPGGDVLTWTDTGTPSP